MFDTFIKSDLREPAAPKTEEINPQISRNTLNRIFSCCASQIPSGFLPCPQHGKIILQTHIYTFLVVALGLQPPWCLMPDPTKGYCIRRKQRGAVLQATGWGSTRRGTALPPKLGARLPSSQETLLFFFFFFARKEPYTQPFSHEALTASQKRAGTRSPAETQFTAAIGDLTTFLSQPVLLPCAGKKLLDADLSSVDSRTGLGGEGCSHLRTSLN